MKQSETTATPTTDADLQQLQQRLATLQHLQPDYPGQLSYVSRLAVLLEKRVIETANAVLKPHGISYVMYHAMVLAYTSCDRALTPSELAKATGESNTNITHICDEMARQELITRRQDERDRRRVVIELTESGTALLRQLQPSVWAMWEQRYQGISPAQLVELKQLLETQLGNLNVLIDRQSGSAP